MCNIRNGKKSIVTGTKTFVALASFLMICSASHAQDRYFSLTKSNGESEAYDIGGAEQIGPMQWRVNGKTVWSPDKLEFFSKTINYMFSLCEFRDGEYVEPESLKSFGPYDYPASGFKVFSYPPDESGVVLKGVVWTIPYKRFFYEFQTSASDRREEIICRLLRNDSMTKRHSIEETKRFELDRIFKDRLFVTYYDCARKLTFRPFLNSDGNPYSEKEKTIVWRPVIKDSNGEFELEQICKQLSFRIGK